VSELERQLLVVGRQLDFPPEPDLSAAVRARLEARPRRPFPWRAAALALAALALALGAAFAVPQARTAILRFFHLRGATVELVGTLPQAVERSQAGGLGSPRSRAAAERAIGFRLVLPPVEGGGPRTVYVLDDGLGTVVLHAYGRPVLLSEYRSSNVDFLRKAVSGRTSVDEVRVGTDPGLWIEGGTHTLTYLDRSGAFRERPILIHGNVLLWVHGPLTLRLEGRLTKDRALALGRRVR
jgi:hypothetical protein